MYKSEVRRKKFSLKNLMLYFFLALTLLLIIGTCDTDEEETNATPENTERQAFSIGDSVKFSDTKWELLGAKNVGERLVSNNFFAEDKHTSGKFIKINFEVTNISKKEIEFNLFIDRHHPKLFDSEGREFKYVDSMSSYLPDSAHTTDSLSSDTKIPAGLSRTFYAIYEVPDSANNLQVEFRSVTNSNEGSLRVSLGL